MLGAFLLLSEEMNPFHGVSMSLESNMRWSLRIFSNHAAWPRRAFDSLSLE